MTTGAYGGASMAIPMVVLVILFPQILIAAAVFGMLVLAALLIRWW